MVIWSTGCSDPKRKSYAQMYPYNRVRFSVFVHSETLTSEVFHFEVFGAGLLSHQRIIQHDFSLSFDALVELPHGHVAQPLHVLTHLVIRL